MKSLLSLTFVLASLAVYSQKLSATFKPYIKEVPGKVLIREAADGNYFLFGEFEGFGNMRASLVKIDGTGKALAGFQNVVFDKAVTHMLELSSGKMLVGGSFNFLNGTSVSKLIRLNADGSIDNSFISDENRDVIYFALQSTGKILLVTHDTQYHLTRLNDDGSLDNTFSTGSPGSNQNINSGFNDMAVDANDKIYLANSYNIFRLAANGAIDNTFTNGATDISDLWGFVLLADGRVIITVEKIVSTTPDYVTADLLMRLNANGSIDNTFTSLEADQYINRPVIRSNGKIVLSGGFNTFNDDYASGAVIELNEDGSYNKMLADTDFNGGYSVMQDSHGNIFVSGGFKTVNYVYTPWVVKIKPDNTVDDSFVVDVSNTGDLFYSGAALQSGGRLVTGAGYNWIGVEDNRDKLVRFLSDGTRDNTFVPALLSSQDNLVNPTVSAVAVQEDDKIIVGGSRLFPNQASFGRLLPDGALDTSFKMGTGPTSTFGLPSISKILYHDSRIYVFGRFQKFDGHESSAIAILDKDGKWVGPANSSLLWNAGVQNVAFQSDGKLVLQGYGFLNGSNDPIIRLNADGTLDESFHIALDGSIEAIAIDTSDNIWAVGNYIDFVSTRFVVKFDKDGMRLPNPTLGQTSEDFYFNARGLAGGLVVMGGRFPGTSGHPSPGMYVIDANVDVVYSSPFDNGSYVNNFLYQNNTLYAFGRFAENNGQDISSICKMVFDIITVPNSFIAQRVNDINATLTWTGDFVGAENTIVEQSLSQTSGYQQLTKTSSTVHTYDVDGLSEATTYYFRISGTNEFYTSDSLVANVVMPVKPEVAMQASEISVDSFVANWEVLPGTDSVMLQVSKDNFASFVSGFDKKILKTNSVKVTGLEDGKAYQYRVKRYKNGLSSEYSAPIVANVITGIESDDHSVSIYPNPVADYLRVRVGDQLNNVRFTLRSITGTMIIDQRIDRSEAEFDIRSFAAGMYIATVESGSGRKDYKVLFSRNSH